MNTMDVMENAPSKKRLIDADALKKAIPETTYESCIHYPPIASDGKPCCFCDPIDPLLNCYKRKDDNIDA